MPPERRKAFSKNWHRMSELVRLIFKAIYKVYGVNRKRNMEHPVTMKIRMIETFKINPAGASEEAANIKIKEIMIQKIKEKYQQEARNRFYDAADEDIWKETIKIYDVREVTRWTDIEDFDDSDLE